MPELRILQYNMHKQKDIMALLVGSWEAREFDVLAIQEPWVNTHQPATHCPSGSTFLPIFNSFSRRSCLLINKRLDPNR
jgi:hypothetical protein